MPHAVIANDGPVPAGQRICSDEWLLAVRRQLERHREFRREQLAAVAAPAEDVRCPALSTSVEDPMRPPELREVAASVIAGARRALANIEAALASMDDGRYGICDACGADIAAPLLEAIPETLLCLDCQRRPGRSRTRYSASGRMPGRGSTVPVR